MLFNHQLIEDELLDIRFYLNKVTSLVNVEAYITNKEEVTEDQVNEIELLIELVCEGTDLKPSDIMQRDGDTVSFESGETNLIQQFLKFLAEKIAQFSKWIKDAWARLTDQRNVLTTKEQMLQQGLDDYAESKDGSKITIKGSRAEAFNIMGKPVLSATDMKKAIEHTRATIELYNVKISPALKVVSKSLVELCKIDSSTGYVEYANLIKNMHEHDRKQTTELKLIRNRIQTIEKIVIDSKDSFIIPGSQTTSGQDMFRTAPLPKNYSISTQFIEPSKEEEVEIHQALQRFHLKFDSVKRPNDADFKELVQPRWSKKECEELVEAVADLNGHLSVFSHLSESSKVELDNFDKVITDLRKTFDRGDGKHEQTTANQVATKRLINTLNHIQDIQRSVPIKLYDHSITVGLGAARIIQAHVSNNDLG